MRPRQTSPSSHSNLLPNELGVADLVEKQAVLAASSKSIFTIAHFV
jgi:hypothetical protein